MEMPERVDNRAFHLSATGQVPIYLLPAYIFTLLLSSRGMFDCEL